MPASMGGRLVECKSAPQYLEAASWNFSLRFRLGKTNNGEKVKVNVQ